MKTLTIEVTNQVRCRLRGLEPKDMRNVRKKLSYFQQWARHSPAYKAGYWDGVEYLCDAGGRTYINLLENVLPEIIENGYQIEIADNRPERHFVFPENIDENIFAGKVWPENHKHAGEPIILRQHQVDALNLFTKNIQSVIELPTSAGKTLITAAMSYLIERYGSSMVVVPSKSLVMQTEEDYRNLGLDVGVYFGDRKELGHKHTICTWQILSAMSRKHKKYVGTEEEERIRSVLFDDLAAIIVDETHSAKAKELKNLLTDYLGEVPIRWGLTGTIPKEEYDRTVIFSTIGPLVGKVEPIELQDAGILSQCDIEILQFQDNRTFADWHGENKYLSEDVIRMDRVSKKIMEKAEGNTLILVNKIATGEALQKLIPNSVFVSGPMKVEKRKEQYDNVHGSDDMVIIATYGVAAVGINIPRIFTLVLFEPGKSFVRVIQSIGRGLRVAEDKDYVQIFDVCSNCKFSKRHLTERKKMYKEKKYPFHVTKVVTL